MLFFIIILNNLYVYIYIFIYIAEKPQKDIHKFVGTFTYFPENPEVIQYNINIKTIYNIIVIIYIKNLLSLLLILIII